MARLRLDTDTGRRESVGPEADPGVVDVGERATRGVAWVALEQWGGQAAGLLMFLVLARLVAPTAFGLIAMAGVVVALMQSLVEKGFADAVVQREDTSREVLDTAFWSTLVFASVAAGLLAISASLTAAIFGEPALTPVVAVMAGTLPLSALGTTHLAVLRRRLDFRPIALRGLCANIAGGGAAIAVALSGGGVWSLVVQSLVTAAAGTALLWTVVDWRPRVAFHWKEFRGLAGFGGSLAGANLVNFANRYADDAIIGMILGPVALGYYTVAYRVFWSGTRALTGVASAVAFPTFSRIRHDSERLNEAFLSSTRITAAIAFPVFAALAAFAPEIVTGLFGARWSPASPVLRVLALMGFLHSIFYLNTSAIVAAGYPAWTMKLNTLYAVLNVVAFWFAVRWGIVAVAAAYVIRGYVTAPVPLLLLRRLIGLDLARYIQGLAGVTAATLLLVLLLISLGSLQALTVPWLLFLALVGGGAVYVGSLALADREILNMLLKGLRQVTRGPPSTDEVEAPGRAHARG